MSNSNFVWLEDCEILAVKMLSVCVRWEGEAHWFPKSQMDDPDRFEKGDSGVTVGITRWIAEQREINPDDC